MIRVCLAGATGWAGSELARGIARSSDIALVAAIARRAAGKVLGDVLNEPRLTASIYASATEALVNDCDVFVEYTKPDTAKANIVAALERGAHVVVGTSGLTDADFAEIDAVAERAARGVLACGNSRSLLFSCSASRRWQPHSSRNGRFSTTRTMTRSTHQAARCVSSLRA